MNAEGAERRRERNAERGKRGGVGWGGSKVIFLLVNVVRLPGAYKIRGLLQRRPHSRKYFGLILNCKDCVNHESLLPVHHGHFAFLVRAKYVFG